MAGSEAKRLGRYGIAGGLSAFAHFAVYHAFVFADWSPHWGYATGFAVSLAVSYILNARFTFRSAGIFTNQFPRFLLVVLSSYGLCQALLYLLIETFDQNPLLAFWILFAIPPVWNYVGMRYCVFGRSSPAKP